MWFANDCVLFVQDAKFFESVFKSQQVITKNAVYKPLTSWLGEGLLLSRSPKWHSRRKIITPTFHFKILEQFVEIFDQQGRVMIKRLHTKADGKTVLNIFPEMCLTALDIIAETAMGVRINAQNHPDIAYVKALTEASITIAMRMMKPFDRSEWFYRNFRNKSYKKLTEDIRIMHEFTDKVIEERRRELEKSRQERTCQAPNINDSDDVGLKKRMAFLDVLLQSNIDGKPLSNQDIREEVDTFMFEGHDTTASGLSYTCYLLSRHPEVQQKVYRELCEVLGDDSGKPTTMQQLHELKYLECVIKESLRLYPPVAIIGRVTEQDVKLDDKIIPANTNINLLIYATCRDADYFPEPDQFKPDRFANSEDTAKGNPFAYVPFSAGPRNCIGQKFAMLEMKSTISKIVRHFELLPLGEEVKPVLNLILRSSTGINLGLKLRGT